MSKKTRKKSSKSTAARGTRASSKAGSGAARPAKAAGSGARKSGAKGAPAKAGAKKAAKAGAAKTRATRAARSTSAPAKAPARKRAAPATKATARTPAQTRPKAKASLKPKSSSKSKTPPKTSRKPAAVESTPAVTPAATPLREGSRLPALTLPRDGGDRMPLAPAMGRNLVIFFYPRADTPGCTKEAMDFSRLATDFDAAKTDIVGISADPRRAQEAFRDKHDLAMPLLSDENHDALEAFGVWGEKSMYGRTFLGIIRTTVVVGPDSRIRKVWRNVKVDGHADEVLAYVRPA